MRTLPSAEEKVTRSVPIPTNESYLSPPRSKILHRHESSPAHDSSDKIHASSSSSNLPDRIDPFDNHVWRSKYCILEEGVLYFYRNANDGNSPEAKSERKQYSSVIMQRDRREQTRTMDIQNLSKSPMPRKMPVRGNPLDLCEPPSMLNVEANSNVIWEKRVALDCVGTVRSVELEYGDNAFELLAIDYEDNPNTSMLSLDNLGQHSPSNRLILQAANGEEMNQWLFEFHRALESFMKNFVNAVQTGHSSRGSLNDCFLGRGSMNQAGVLFGDALSSSLSHGHGRSGMHRRRDRHLGRESPLYPESSPLVFSTNKTQKHQQQQPHMPGLPDLFSKSASPKDSASTGSLGSLIAEKIAPPKAPPVVEKPQTEKPPAATKPKRGKYLPPHLRKGGNKRKPVAAFPPDSKTQSPGTGSTKFQDYKSDGSCVSNGAEATTRPQEADLRDERISAGPQIRRGGCADPAVTEGSIMDPKYTSRSSSVVGKVRTKAFGAFGGSKNSTWNNNLFEVGAASECGIRASNEDAYLVACDLFETFESQQGFSSSCSRPDLFAVFDGHCGNQAARFAAEKLSELVCQEWMKINLSPGDTDWTLQIQHVVRNAISRLDCDFCNLCSTDGRDWDSGATVIVAILLNDHVVIANLGDCRGVSCRAATSMDELTPDSDWSILHPDTENNYFGGLQNIGLVQSNAPDSLCYWKEVTDAHTPSRKDERARIEKAQGWITTEKEIPIGQLRRMDFEDRDVVEILKRCFADRYDEYDPSGQVSKRSSNAAAPQRILQISRVCGELAVSRAIGDREFKASFNNSDPSPDSMLPIDCQSTVWWACPLPLPYPENHPRRFDGDLVSAEPEFQVVKLGQDGADKEFLILACDGLWDVMDPDDAVRVTRSLLFEKKGSAKKAAERLAELAIHLGSSDNVTVIVIRFLDTKPPNVPNVN
eukprot:CAMPEP_0118721890 /NCGR_PEP_ID=MMETSP0800-20121206/31038_1 /TAXON_ID=210618 ORGANISM="Striatella unipunctata, Strain CCMP2910" /NCGR_SAMPLE_ID=MMETSP0800 /ASSEMBLY_ACC=CAM_ASM_000638 /LENGTH=932 /DNA_ID=CAMNT_0006629933 /DNA_START=273 /DNA_END=3071 /DNA_ORIENTATION=+